MGASTVAAAPSRGGTRYRTKRLLARALGSGRPRGATLLTYHRVGGGSGDELDTDADAFEAQLDALAGCRVEALDAALDRLAQGDDSPTVVLTFDDGFAEVHDVAWPLLRDRRLPFVLYLATAYVDAPMRWEGANTTGDGRGLTWAQIGGMVDSGLCTVGNHTHSHARPERLTEAELDRCDGEIERHLGVRARHFAYPWGIPVPAMHDTIGLRFRSAATGTVGRNGPNTDPAALRRVPVRRTDPMELFTAKVRGGLGAEHAYDGIVRVAKALKGASRRG